MRQTASEIATLKLSCLWVDLGGRLSHLFEAVSSLYPAYRTSDREAVWAYIDQIAPRFVAFELDHLHEADLRLLQETASRYPRLPLLTLTDDQSTDGAYRACRIGVWSYMIKPVAVHELFEKIRFWLTVANYRVYADNPIPPAYLHSGHAPSSAQMSCARRTDRAIDYIAAHYGDEINLRTVADSCHISPGQFSKIFKREHRLSFREFLVRFRLDRACKLLREGKPVKTAAFSSGFSDLSYFSRVFRRRLKMTPREFKASNITYGSLSALGAVRISEVALTNL